jgi:hypothetical protein
MTKYIRVSLAALILLWALPASAQVLPLSATSIAANNTTVCANVDKSIPSVTFVFSGTFVATLAPRVRFDASGSTDFTPPAEHVSTGSITTTGSTLTIANYGVRKVCVRTTAYTSGTINLTAVASGTSSLEATRLAQSAANDVAPGTSATGLIPVGIGCTTLGLGSDPTGVAAVQRQNIHCTTDGQLFILGGHPNAVTRGCRVADADGAQTGAACVTVSAGTRIVVTRATVTCSAANTVNVAVRIMFDTDSTFASSSTTGVSGEIYAHDGIYPGGGGGTGDGSAVVGIGADDEDVRYTMADPVSGACTVNVTYFTIQG